MSIRIKNALSALIIFFVLLMLFPRGYHAEDVLAISTTLTCRQWEDAITFLDQNLRLIHPNLFFKRSEQDYAADMAGLKRNLLCMSDVEISLRLMQIVASLGEPPNWSSTCAIIPVAPLRSCRA